MVNITLLDFVLNDKKESRKEWLKVVFQYHAKYNKNNTNYQVWQQNNQPKNIIKSKIYKSEITVYT